MKTYPIEGLPKDKIIEFFKLHWGSPEMVISSGVYNCSELDGFAIVNEDDNIIGLITYVIKDYECEIISLDSIEEGKGIGSSLVEEVEYLATKKKCKLVKLITTNDNLLALKFYQKRGFVISKVFKNSRESEKVKTRDPFHW